LEFLKNNLSDYFDDLVSLIHDMVCAKEIKKNKKKRITRKNEKKRIKRKQYSKKSSGTNDLKGKKDAIFLINKELISLGRGRHFLFGRCGRGRVVVQRRH
jgi:hypothetical protein